MKTNFLKNLIAMVFLFGAVGFAQAQSSEREERREPPTFEELLEKLDEDEDGKLSEEEVDGPLKEMFTEIDTDEDGYISEKEFENAPKPERKERGGRR